ncbi:MAG: TspO/MBR family protein [Sphingomonadaceae bacterium]
MSRSWIFPAVLAGFAALLVAMLGATITDLGAWYQSLDQPRWAPPDPLYGIAWTLIFALIAVAAVTAWRKAPDQGAAQTIVGLFALNGFLNLLWSLIFFRAQRPDWALIEVAFLWLSIVVLIIVCGRHSRLAALLLLPYLAWVSFAALLNWEIVRLNSPFG